MTELVARTGRQQQRYEAGCWLVAGCFSHLSLYSHHMLMSCRQFMLGIPSPSCADRQCTDSCSQEAKHTETQYLTWFGKTAYIHGRVPYYQRQRKDYNTIHEGGGLLHSNSTPSSLAVLAVAAIAAPSFSLVLYCLALSLLSLLCSLAAYLQARMVSPAPTLLQQRWLPTLALLQQWWLPTFDILDGCTWLVQLQLQALDNGNPLLEQGCYHISGNIPTVYVFTLLSVCLNACMVGFLFFILLEEYLALLGYELRYFDGSR